MWRRKVKDNVCYRFSSQIKNWKLSHVSSRGIPLWHHTVSTKTEVKNQWSMKSSKLTRFLGLQNCENKRKRILFAIPPPSFNHFVWATRKRKTMETSWHPHIFYPILAAGRYLPQFWHISKMTMLDRKTNFKTCGSKHTLGIPKNSQPVSHLRIWRNSSVF